DSLDSLPFAADALFNANLRRHEPTCLPDTRVNLLEEIYKWADVQDGPCIFWLNGLAGTGKSTIARTVARTYLDQKKRLGASFFFSRGGGDIGHADKFVTSITKQLASNIPSLDQHICDAIKERRDIVNQSLSDQWQQLVVRPLSKLGKNDGQSTYILVVDALDECDNNDDIQLIIDLLAEVQQSERVRLRVFLTSRPEVPIRHGFRELSGAEHQDFVLHDISPSIINHDIRTYLDHSFKDIARECYLDASWPGDETIKRLVENASGLFIWAATACRFIRKGRILVEERLRLILEHSSSTVNEPEKHLNKIYLTVLHHCISEYSDEELEHVQYRLKRLLGSIIALRSPLSAQSLSQLLNSPQGEVDQILDSLHSILVIPKDRSHLRLHHPSFRDFLYEKTRCEEFWVDEMQAHQILADNCIRLMSKSLKQDMVGVRAPGTLVSDTPRDIIERSLPSELQYACLHWIAHVTERNAQPQGNEQIYRFLGRHLLHWLECLGWMGKVPEGVHAIDQGLVVHSAEPSWLPLSEFIHDAKRFVLYNRLAIEQAPLQAYSSALVFAPTGSIIRKQFEDCIPRWIRRLPKVTEEWNAVLQTLEGHSNSVTSVAFSPDGKTLVSASDDHTVKVWDAGSGALRKTLEGHS
ncbi:hypothetical protein K402DRAFT_313463, partial [Aulographum hederae CBS 113979]